VQFTKNLLKNISKINPLIEYIFLVFFYYQRGRLNELQNNIEEAIACYESALSVFPKHKAASQRVVSNIIDLIVTKF